MDTEDDFLRALMWGPHIFLYSCQHKTLSASHDFRMFSGSNMWTVPSTKVHNNLVEALNRVLRDFEGADPKQIKVNASKILREYSFLTVNLVDAIKAFDKIANDTDWWEQVQGRDRGRRGDDMDIDIYSLLRYLPIAYIEAILREGSHSISLKGFCEKLEEAISRDYEGDRYITCVVAYA